MLHSKRAGKIIINYIANRKFSPLLITIGLRCYVLMSNNNADTISF